MLEEDGFWRKRMEDEERERQLLVESVSEAQEHTDALSVAEAAAAVEIVERDGKENAPEGQPWEGKGRGRGRGMNGVMGGGRDWGDWERQDWSNREGRDCRDRDARVGRDWGERDGAEHNGRGVGGWGGERGGRGRAGRDFDRDRERLGDGRGRGNGRGAGWMPFRGGRRGRWGGRENVPPVPFDAAAGRRRPYRPDSPQTPRTSASSTNDSHRSSQSAVASRPGAAAQPDAAAFTATSGRPASAQVVPSAASTTPLPPPTQCGNTPPGDAPQSVQEVNAPSPSAMGRAPSASQSPGWLAGSAHAPPGQLGPAAQNTSDGLPSTTAGCQHTSSPVPSPPPPGLNHGNVKLGSSGAGASPNKEVSGSVPKPPIGTVPALKTADAAAFCSRVNDKGDPISAASLPKQPASPPPPRPVAVPVSSAQLPTTAPVASIQGHQPISQPQSLAQPQPQVPPPQMAAFFPQVAQQFSVPSPGIHPTLTMPCTPRMLANQPPMQPMLVTSAAPTCTSAKAGTPTSRAEAPRTPNGAATASSPITSAPLSEVQQRGTDSTTQSSGHGTPLAHSGTPPAAAVGPHPAAYMAQQWHQGMIPQQQLGAMGYQGNPAMLRPQYGRRGMYTAAPGMFYPSMQPGVPLNMMPPNMYMTPGFMPHMAYGRFPKMAYGPAQPFDAEARRPSAMALSAGAAAFVPAGQSPAKHTSDAAAMAASKPAAPAATACVEAALNGCAPAQDNAGPVKPPPPDLPPVRTKPPPSAESTASTSTSPPPAAPSADGAPPHEIKQQVHAVRGGIGLSNRAGDNHCFLNVIVQVLWRLKPFSAPLLAASLPSSPPANATHSSERRLLRELVSIFHRFESAERATSADAEGRAVLSSAVLRAALPSTFAEGMQDATECLADMLSALHQAEVGSDADISLPRQATVPASSIAPPHASPAASQQAQTWASRLTTTAPAPAGAAAAAAAVHSPSHVAQTFGLTVQLPHTGHKAPPGHVAVEHFTRFFQHVHTKLLCAAAATARSSSMPFDWTTAVRTSGFNEGPSVQLLSRPKVLVLHVIWPAPSPGKAAIREVVDVLQHGQTLDLGKLFTGVSQSTLFRLKCAPLGLPLSFSLSCDA
jgi:hypothetical protein